jgi:hypothetical protein
MPQPKFRGRRRMRTIQEHQPVRLLAHAGLTLCPPDAAFIPHVGACALRRHQLFFYT